MKNKKIAIFPGTFNPIHKGHINILKKALNVFDFVYVVISNNPDKEKKITYQQKMKQVSEALKGFKNIEIIINDKELTGEFAKKINASFLIRSARNDLDFKYEYELAIGNKIVNPSLETILFFPDEDTIGYSSTLERHKKLLREEE